MTSRAEQGGLVTTLPRLVRTKKSRTPHAERVSRHARQARLPSPDAHRGPLAHPVSSKYRRSAFSGGPKPESRESTTATLMRQTLRTLTAQHSVREKETSTPKPGHGVKCVEILSAAGRGGCCNRTGS
ncbi:uncharacterized protein BDZ83DRAFT_604398 [Colletotrichum acutatum]|uniref:Uncharacterized protein n=1 Tax=Glomerella acutata TaxID=27357 RepID=A0AAD8XLK1_GLOAC|nr:uncharacterized protein BDZ83DRAFT_604398 [Colletotrichum acutatum]KAK1729606.1 hypothetical protein BDZ83DRAFT_604398 [Colletotrichum acutatum]